MDKSIRPLRRAALLLAGAGLVAGLVGSSVAGAASTSGASSAGSPNPYAPSQGHPYRHGAVPTRGQQAKMNGWAATQNSGTASTGPKTLSYGGGISGVGVTSGTPKVYLVFWGSQWGTSGTDGSGNLTFSSDPSGAAPYLQNMFKGLGTGGELWSGTMTQYCDGLASGSTSCPATYPRVGYPTGGALAGVWYDNTSAQPVPSSGNQLAQEAVTAAAHFGNTTAAANRYAQYDIVSATGTNPDSWLTGGYCAWHDFTGDTTLDGGGAASSGSIGGPVAFTNMPYVLDAGASCGENFVNASSGTLDGFSIVNGHEYAETVTDQFPAGGWTNHQLNSFRGEENGDECAWISSGQGASANVSMGTGSFAMQSTWSNDTNECDISHANVSSGSTANTVTVKSPGNQTTRVNTTVRLQMTATDSASGQSFTYSASGLPKGLSISSAGLITGAPSAVGSYTVTVTAKDTTGATGSTTFTWNVKRH